jgi:hypothetical protein
MKRTCKNVIKVKLVRLRLEIGEADLCTPCYILPFPGKNTIASAALGSADARVFRLPPPEFVEWVPGK